ncbi:hypothetical protein B0H13DRAFT_1879785 [Mycena leptocephala]|nr:hypothetical protein B0H13DRAFT_1879785 [Mycena leptocephala]
MERIQGFNFLGRIPLHTVPVQINRIGPIEDWVEVDVPALLVWEDRYMTWLVLGQRPVCSQAVYALPGANYDGDGEFGNPEVDSDSDKIRIHGHEDSQGDYAYSGVFSNWTYWLTGCRGGRIKWVSFVETEVNISGPRLNGVEVTEDEWFWSQPRSNRVWAESHDTGRQSAIKVMFLMGLKSLKTSGFGLSPDPTECRPNRMILGVNVQIQVNLPCFD